MTAPKDTHAALRAEIALKATNPAHESRLLSRHNLIPNTVGLAPGYLQANLVVLPSAHASDFRDLCARNPVACPLLGYTPPGDPHTVLPAGVIASPDFDVRTDFPHYRVFQHGEPLALRKPDILAEWESDSVAFLIGCSLSFEEALLAAGVFCDGATCVVSMRTYRPEEVEAVRDISRPYLAAHGEPVAWGWEGAERIGVRDVHAPDFGAKQTFREGEIPVFWGCGVTPQNVVMAAGKKIGGTVMSHEPGEVLVTDLTVDDLPMLRHRSL